MNLLATATLNFLKRSIFNVTKVSLSLHILSKIILDKFSVNYIWINNRGLRYSDQNFKRFYLLEKNLLSWDIYLFKEKTFGQKQYQINFWFCRVFKLPRITIRLAKTTARISLPLGTEKLHHFLLWP